MRIKVTKGGLYGANGEIPVGTTATVKDIPESWKHFVTVLEGDPSEDHEAVTAEDEESEDDQSTDEETDPSEDSEDTSEEDEGTSQPSRRRGRR